MLLATETPSAQRTEQSILKISVISAALWQNLKAQFFMENGKLLRTILAPHWWDLSPWEAKTFITIFWFADPATGELAISLYSLSQKVNSLTRDLLPWLEKLKLRGLIDIAPGPNPRLKAASKYCLVNRRFQRRKRSKRMRRSSICRSIRRRRRSPLTVTIPVPATAGL